MAEHKQEQAETEEQSQQESPQAELETGAADAGAAGEAAEGEPSLETVVEQLQEDLLAARDAALRSQADAQNVKRRAEQDVEKARKFALEQFSRELLPVVDNLERALEATAGEDEAVKPIAEGVELTLKSFLDALKKFNIEAVDPRASPSIPTCTRP